jgi:hypothetical protein
MWAETRTRTTDDAHRRLRASLLTELVAAARRRRCQHRMVAMTDGPVCGDCGRTWRWALTKPTT